jgi:hypothetical protein
MQIDIDLTDLEDLIKNVQGIPEEVELAASRALARAGDQE